MQQTVVGCAVWRVGIRGVMRVTRENILELTTAAEHSPSLLPWGDMLKPLGRASIAVMLGLKYLPIWFTHPAQAPLG